jgi:hypothetical protein
MDPMLTPKRMAAVVTAAAAIGAFGPVAGAGAATTPTPAPSGWQAGADAFQTGWQAGLAGWQAGADAARQGWEAGRAGMQVGANAAIAGWQSWLEQSQPTLQVPPRR